MGRALLHSPTRAALGTPAGLGRTSLRAGRVVLGAAVGLTALGLVMLYSSSSALGVARGGDPTFHLARQLRWVALGVGAGWMMAVVPLTLLRRVARPVLFTTLVLLVYTLAFGHEVKHSRRWIRIAGASLQASEFLKIALLLYLADRLAARDEASAFERRTPLLAMLAPVGLGAALVLVQPDLGMALFLVAESVVLLALAGVRPTRVLPFAATVAPLLMLYGYTRFAHVRRRLAGPGAQVEESLVAIGSGGPLGRGLGEGLQKVGVPETNTDFIFAVIGEELGFLGCAAVVLAFMAMAWYGRRVAWNARVLGPYAYYLAAGAVFFVTFQALINVAVVTASAPTKGIPLPFISMGGSNLLVCCMAVGLVLGIARRTAAAAGDDPWA
ncbi:MAG: FtsW/RodA/SpoVE family cell cycle protein [Planctomycetota bacterium]|jgi:cell division protein FtsW